MYHINKTENVNFLMEFIYNFMWIKTNQYIKMNVEYHHLLDRLFKLHLAEIKS